MADTMQIKVALSGGGGFVGRHLQGFLRSRGVELVLISRSKIYGGGDVLASALSGADVVIHLSGAAVVGRWTAAYRRKIYDSRIVTTRNMVEAMSLMDVKPQLFLCASAVGIYPSDGVHTEESAHLAGGFLGEVCRDWEQEAMRAKVFTRVVSLRFGTILGINGGALKRMMLPFRLGLGGRIGTGLQMMSWVHVDDVVRAVWHVISRPAIFGAVHVTAPNPVSNREFTRLLAMALRRPALFTVPVFVLKMLYGDGASVVTEGQVVLPERLQQSGFQFMYATLSDALNALVRK